MRFYLPKISNEKNLISYDEYARRTELITKMALAGWLKEYEIREYLEGIIAEASTYDSDDSLLWLVDKPENMPSDAGRAYLYQPLFNITAFMSKAYFISKHWMDEIPGFRETLKGALRSVSKRVIRPETIELFEQAGLYQLLYYEKDICPELFATLENARNSK